MMYESVCIKLLRGVVLVGSGASQSSALARSKRNGENPLCKALSSGLSLRRNIRIGHHLKTHTKTSHFGRWESQPKWISTTESFKNSRTSQLREGERKMNLRPTALGTRTISSG